MSAGIVHCAGNGISWSVVNRFSEVFGSGGFRMPENGPQTAFLAEIEERASNLPGCRMPRSSSTTLQLAEEVDSGNARNYATSGTHRKITRR